MDEGVEGKLDQETVETRFAGDRTFKTNQQWVTPAPTVTKGEIPKFHHHTLVFIFRCSSPSHNPV